MQLRALRKLAPKSAIASALLIAACNLGDDFIGPGFGFAGGSTGGGFVDASYYGDPASPCASAVDQGSCAYSSQEKCEVGEHPSPSCNALLSCDGTRWRSESPREEACATDCPNAYTEDLPDGCAIPNAHTLICGYPEGTCGCAPVRPVSDGGDAGKATEDAGETGDADAGATAYVWKCVHPEAGCPRMRPRAGSACVKPLVCDYGLSVFGRGDGVRMRCYGNVIGGSSSAGGRAGYWGFL